VKDAAKRQALFESFAQGFLRALLEGQQVQLTRLLGADLLDHFAVASCADSSVDEAIYARLHAHILEHAPVRSLAYPCRETRAFTMAVHDLLALTDPLLDRMISRRALPKVAHFIDALLESASAPRTRSEVLARHVILSRALALKRRDVVVKNWAYTYRFFGRPVPRNVVMLPTIRRVRQTEEQTHVRALLRSDRADDGKTHDGADAAAFDPSSTSGAALLQRVLLRSPYTRMLEFDRDEATLLDVSTVAVLGDASLAQGLIFELSKRDAAAVLTRFGSELWRLRASRDVPTPVLRVATSFVLQLGLSRLLATRGATDAALDSTASFELAIALALPAAALDSPGTWPWLSHADNTRARLGARAWAERVGAAACGEARHIIAEASREAPLEVAS